MEKEQESNPNPISSVECEECKLNPWKYKCPGCSIRTCSLPCVNSHKQRTACNGKKSLTEVLPLSQFDDNILLSGMSLFRPKVWIFIVFEINQFLFCLSVDFVWNCTSFPFNCFVWNSLLWRIFGDIWA